MKKFLAWLVFLICSFIILTLICKGDWQMGLCMLMIALAILGFFWSTGEIF